MSKIQLQNRPRGIQVCDNTRQNRGMSTKDKCATVVTGGMKLDSENALDGRADDVSDNSSGRTVQDHLTNVEAGLLNMGKLLTYIARQVSYPRQQRTRWLGNLAERLSESCKESERGFRQGRPLCEHLQVPPCLTKGSAKSAAFAQPSRQPANPSGASVLKDQMGWAG